MRLAVTGTSGQVVRSLLDRRFPDTEVVAIGRPALDLAEPNTILDALGEARPDAIVSAAAYTAVDKAESEPDLAHRINAEGAGAVAAAAAALGVPIIHLSTDYVFDGRSDAPYRENDPTAPATRYGASKFAGERAVADAAGNHAILRTAWVYSPFGHNFVRTILRLAETRDEIGVVGDQIGNPTSALDLAQSIVTVAKQMISRPDDAALRGLFHAAGTGAASWADFAEAVFARSGARGGPTASVRAISTTDYPTAAPRPANSRLDCTKLLDVYGIRLPEWRESVNVVVDRIMEART
jgi:dTDP-4-dehydrorhamnose reductase